MQPTTNYQEMLTTLRKLIRGARQASEQGKYNALERIMTSVEKISDQLVSAQEKIFIKANLDEGNDYIKVTGEIVN